MKEAKVYVEYNGEKRKVTNKTKRRRFKNLEDTFKMLELYENGLTLMEIGDKFGLSYEGVRNRLQIFVEYDYVSSKRQAGRPPDGIK